MKPSNVIIVLTIALTVNIVLSQETNGNNVEKTILSRFAVKAGIEWSSFTNHSPYKYYNVFDDNNITGSVKYQHSKKVSFVVEYVYKPNYGYGKYFELSQSVDSSGGLLESMYSNQYDLIYSNSFNLGMNYNVANIAKNSPVYLLGMVSASIQSVQNHDAYIHNVKVEPFHYETYQSDKVIDSYNRVLIGTKAGIGVTYMFGKFGVNLEAYASLKVSPFKDKGYKEVSYSLSFAPMYKF